MQTIQNQIQLLQCQNQIPKKNFNFEKQAQYLKFCSVNALINLIRYFSQQDNVYIQFYKQSLRYRGIDFQIVIVEQMKNYTNQGLYNYDKSEKVNLSFQKLLVSPHTPHQNQSSSRNKNQYNDHTVQQTQRFINPYILPSYFDNVYYNKDLSNEKNNSYQQHNLSKSPFIPSAIKQTQVRQQLRQLSQHQQPSIVPVSLIEQNCEPNSVTHNKRNKISEQILASYSEKLVFPDQNYSILKEMQRLKMSVTFLEEQNSNLKAEKEQIARQKKSLNESYISLLNGGLQSEEQNFQQIQRLKVHFSQQLSSITLQFNSKLQAESFRHNQEISSIVNNFKQRQLSYQALINEKQTQIHRLKTDIQLIKGENMNIFQKIKGYQQAIYKKQFQLEEANMRQTIIKREIEQKRKEMDDFRREIDNLRREMDGLKRQVQYKNKQIDHLKSINGQTSREKSLLNEKSASAQRQMQSLIQANRQLRQEVSVLTKVTESTHTQLLQSTQTIERLTDQLQSLDRSYSQLNTQFLQSSIASKQLSQSLSKQLTTMKFIESKLRQENTTLMKQVQNLKQREIRLIESERQSRDQWKVTLERKNKQVENLCQENQRLYREINKIKFSAEYRQLDGSNIRSG